MQWNEDKKELVADRMVTDEEAETLARLLAKSQGLYPDEIVSMVVLCVKPDGMIQIGGSSNPDAALELIQGVAFDFPPANSSVQDNARQWCEEHLS